jgi:hypothetical protein
MDFVESNCTVEHAGTTYEFGGAFRHGDHALVYVRRTETGYKVTSWHGFELGTASVVSTWKRYNKWGEPSTWKSYRVLLNDGSRWYGRHNSDWADALRIKRRK